MSLNVKKELKHLLKNWISPSRAAKSIWITVAPGFTYLRRVGSCFFSCSRLRTWSNLKHQHQYLSGILLLSMHQIFVYCISRYFHFAVIYLPMKWVPLDEFYAKFCSSDRIGHIVNRGWPQTNSHHVWHYDHHTSTYSGLWW